MTLRFKWFKLWLPDGLPALVRALKKSPMPMDGPSGFRQLREEGDAVYFRFAWRSTVSTTALDEDGNLTVQQVQTINFVDLKFFPVSGSIFLRVDNPGKSLRSLMNELGARAGYGFASQPVVFSDVQPPSFFSHFDQVQLVGIKLINVVFDRHVVGRIELASKEGIDLESLDVSRKTYVVDTAVYDVLSRLVRGQLAFNKSGLVKVSERIAAQFLSVFEPTLESFLVSD